MEGNKQNIKKLSSVLLALVMLVTALSGGLHGAVVTAQGLPATKAAASQLHVVNARGGSSKTGDLQLLVNPMGDTQVKYQNKFVFNNEGGGRA